jgi:hypothetical protein
MRKTLLSGLACACVARGKLPEFSQDAGGEKRYAVRGARYLQRYLQRGVSRAQHRSRSSTQHAAPRASCSLLWQIARAVGQVRTGQDRQSQRPSRHHTHRQRQLHSLLDIHSLVEPVSLSEGTICTLSRLFTATVLSLSRVRARRRAAQPALRMPSSAPSRHAR